MRSSHERGIKSPIFSVSSFGGTDSILKKVCFLLFVKDVKSQYVRSVSVSFEPTVTHTSFVFVRSFIPGTEVVHRILAGVVGS